MKITSSNPAIARLASSVFVAASILSGCSSRNVEQKISPTFVPAGFAKIGPNSGVAIPAYIPQQAGDPHVSADAKARIMTALHT